MGRAAAVPWVPVSISGFRASCLRFLKLIAEFQQNLQGVMLDLFTKNGTRGIEWFFDDWQFRL